MWSIAFLVGTLVATCLSLGMAWWRRGSLTSRWVGLIVLIPTGFIAIGSACEALMDWSMSLWSSPRLAAALGFYQGLPLYQPSHDGPVLIHIYTPLSALALAPVLLAVDPISAILIGEAVNLFFYLMPLGAIWFFCSDRRSASGAIGLGLCVAMLLLIAPQSPALSFSMFSVHADAQALGFTGLACAPLMSDAGAKRGRNIILAGIFSVLAVASKQTTVPIVAAIAVWLTLLTGPRAVWRYTLACAATAVVLTILLAFMIDYPNMWFNAVTVPRRHPMQGQFPLNFISKINEMIGYTGPFLQIAIVALCWRTWRADTASGQKIRRWLEDEKWVLLLVIAVFLIPTMMAAATKVGGSRNNYAYFLYPIYLALSTLVIRELSVKTADPAGPDLKLLLVTSFVAATAAVRFLPIVQSLRYAEEGYHNQHQISYEYLKAHPGQVYFPWHPLAHLMVEGRLTHHEYGLVDRYNAGFGITASHFKKDGLGQAQVICLPPGDQLQYKPQWFQDLVGPDVHPIELPDLPGWNAYELK